jgi:hypothetical protein
MAFYTLVILFFGGVASLLLNALFYELIKGILGLERRLEPKLFVIVSRLIFWIGLLISVVIVLFTPDSPFWINPRL